MTKNSASVLIKIMA